MKAGIAYFFGAGTEVEFTNFSLAHFLPILALIGVVYLIWRNKDRLRNSASEMNWRYGLSFALIICEMSYYWRLVGIPELGPNPVDHLPITVCGWVVIFCSLMVLGKSQMLFDICYFWLFSGTLFALITPTVITYTGPTRFRYYQFWLEHTLGYIAVFYMMFVHGMRPTPRSALRSGIALVVLAAVAYTANRLIGPGANYLFMAQPEDTPSVLDILPASFGLRLLVMAAAVGTLFAVSYLPWYLKDRRGEKTA